MNWFRILVVTWSICLCVLGSGVFIFTTFLFLTGGAEFDLFNAGLLYAIGAGGLITGMLLAHTYDKYYES